MAAWGWAALADRQDVGSALDWPPRDEPDLSLGVGAGGVRAAGLSEGRAGRIDAGWRGPCDCAGLAAAMSLAQGELEAPLELRQARDAR